MGGYTQTMKVILDTNLKCTDRLDEEGIEYNFKYLQCPLSLTKKVTPTQDVVYEPLTILNVMVQHNRIELLNHPVCKEYLLMKWCAYGFRAHMMNLGSYCLGLIPMTFLVVKIKPGLAFNSTGIINETTDHLETVDTLDAFSSPLLSLIQTFTMMLGDINYRDAFLEPLLKKELAYPILTFGQLILFTMFVPIVLMNLLIGLAVGDIAEVQKHASLKRSAMQVELHTNLEKKLPLWYLRKVDQKSTIVLKDLTSLLEKQHELIKLIIQKMEIISETEDEDNHCSFQDKFKKERLEQMQSKWNFVLNAVKTKTH
ncbi:Transient receptor potential cation channel subfamily A member 1 [Cricetulus griseus]|uniref:Transient receptor potential cation channel subfamily A member 1 n=1 Tax=Cricetulus griseus TaxID=10029 RepID=G3I2K2_CRIGR|nr:Transient receptor potential cation channel subfamily A member 1 [Cricetulus griseus]